jgi:hypothetical protein
MAKRDAAAATDLATVKCAAWKQIIPDSFSAEAHARLVAQLDGGGR